MRSTSQDQRTRGEDYVAPEPVPKAKRTRGRPHEFEADYVPRAAELAANGYDMQEIADELGVARSTIWAWRYRFPEFSNAINTARDIADDRVEMALERTAREGNTTAQIFWLKNRRPAKWRDRHETEIIVPEGEATEAAQDGRALALAALALFNDASYDPQPEPAHAGPMIEGHAREEIEDGEAHLVGREPGTDTGARPVGEDVYDPDFDLDTE